MSSRRRNRGGSKKKSPAKVTSPQQGKQSSPGANGAVAPDSSPVQAHSQPINSPSSVSSVESPCVKCGTEVIENATKCDRCMKYTHISCDDNMNQEIYGILVKFPNNPLLYLCSKCRPKFSGDVNHERYIDTAMSKLDQALKENHSSTEFQLDMLVQAVTSRMGTIESIANEVRSQVSDLNTRVYHVKKSLEKPTTIRRPQSYNPVGPIPSAPPDPDYPNSEQSEPCSLADVHHQTARGPTSGVSDQPNHRQNRPNINQSNTAPTPNIPYGSQNTPPNIHHMRQVMNNMSQANNDITMNLQTPPNIRYMRDMLCENQWEHQRPRQSYENTPNFMMPHMPPPCPPTYKYRGPPLYPISNQRSDNPPDPEVSLVVYGLDPLSPPQTTISDMARKCDIDITCITTIKKLPSTRPRPPVLVSCSDSTLKWRMIRYVNSCDNVYAKPFLLGEDRRKDRVLVNHLRELRQKRPDEVFKISRGEIYQQIDENFVRLRPYTNLHSHF